LVANVVGRGFVLDSDSGDKAIDDVNGYRWAEWAGSPEACDDQQEFDFHGLEKLTLQHVIIDGDLCSLPNRDGGIESQEGHRLKILRPTRPWAATSGIQMTEQKVTERTEGGCPLSVVSVFSCSKFEPWRSVVRVGIRCLNDVRRRRRIVDKCQLPAILLPSTAWDAAESLAYRQLVCLRDHVSHALYRGVHPRTVCLPCMAEWAPIGEVRHRYIPCSVLTSKRRFPRL
jgi:hypothetical protein